MNALPLFIYNIAIRIFAMSVAMAAPFHKKAKKWQEGRKLPLPSLPAKKGKRLWFHCASLGEFEQARPVIAKWRALHQDDLILLSFYSPSGFEVRKNYTGVDAVLYLPLDSKSNAKEFLDWASPDMALFVKYEFWYHFLHELKRRNIPVILFSSLFRPQQIFFRWYGGLFVDMLRCFSKILVQNQSSKGLLDTLGVQSEVAYDTRFDRVAQVAADRIKFPVVETFKADKKLLIAGSTWPKDEQLLISLMRTAAASEYKFLIAPHDVSPERINNLKQRIPLRTESLSVADQHSAGQSDVLIVDTMGQLSSLYSYADVAYIGGGFDASVHNVLEAVVFGIPVLFGANYQKSLEAIELLKSGGAFCVNDEMDLKSALDQCSKRSFEFNRIYVTQRTGGTEMVLREMELLITGKKTSYIFLTLFTFSYL